MRKAAFIFLALLFSACQPMGYQETWDKATLFIANPSIKSMRDAGEGLGIEARPTVLYLHGCSGIGFEDSTWAAFLRDNGYTVIAPDSYERPAGRVGCGGDLQERIRMRQEELHLAMQRLHGVPWVDADHLYLMGFSEGAHTLSLFEDAPSWIRGVILVGVDCQVAGGSPVLPESIPVLNIVGSQDEYGFGRGCQLHRTARGTRLMVVPEVGHVGLAVMPSTRQAIRDFLDVNGG